MALRHARRVLLLAAAVLSPTCLAAENQTRFKLTGTYAGGESSGPPWTDASLNQSSGAPLLTFYMYRAVSDESYPPVNINAANLPGVLWYLHHEVVVQSPRKFNIQKIMRFKVQTRATAPLAKQGMNFGARLAFDKGQATGPFVCGRKETAPEPEFVQGAFQNQCLGKLDGYHHPFEWEKFGYFVGCNNLGDFPFPEYPVAYPGAAWYSLPGDCPSRQFYNHDDQCRRNDPGGLCQGVEPNGNGTCTWNYEMAGEITINELTGFNGGGREYDPFTDKGVGFSWWDGIDDKAANAERVAAASKLFAAKYPDEPSDEDLPAPPCDFKYNAFYREWYYRPVSGEACTRYKPGSKCLKSAQWARGEGMATHPEWYPGLSTASPIQEFEKILYQQGRGGCDEPPCSA